MQYKDLLRFRQAWLGIAMCMIIFYHIPIEVPSRLMQFFKHICYGGVDICLFASGVGCYYSLDRNPDPGVFLKRRFHRLAPTYLTFIVCWLIVQALDGDFSIQMAIGNILGIQHFTGLNGAFNWYISALLLFYILAPYLKIIVDRATPLVKSSFLFLFVIASIPFWGNNTYIITVTRLPVFYLGVYFGQICKGESTLNVRSFLIAFGSIFSGVLSLLFFFRYQKSNLWSYGLYWYPFILIAPALCIIFSYGLNRLAEMNRFPFIASALTLVGNYSFELYLLHIFLISSLSRLIQLFALQHLQLPIYFVGILLLPIGCMLLKHLARLCVACCAKLNNSTRLINHNHQ